MKKSDFTGTLKVFSFTLVQYLKSKATISMLITMLILSAVCTFIMANSMGSAISDEYNAGKVTLLNSSGFDIKFNDITDYSEQLANADITITDSEFESVFEQLDSDPLAVAILVEPNDFGSYSLTTYTGSSSSVNYYTTSLLNNAASGALTAARCRILGVTDAQLDTALAPFTVASVSERDFVGSDDGGLPGGESFMVITYAYSIIVMMLVMFSTTYIVRSIAEEKSSKLVELLMVSIKPLALVLGKILATMCFMVASMLVLVLGAFGSSLLAKQFFGMSFSSDMLTSAGINISFSGVGIILIFVVFVSIALGYLTFSILGGIAGATCSSMEDIGPASNIIAFLALGGYMTALFSSIFGDRAFLTACSLFPIISIFTAPVSYASGIIGFGTLCLSWLIQIIVIALLASFAAKVYGALIIYRGNRVRLGQLFRIAREAKKGA